MGISVYDYETHPNLGFRIWVSYPYVTFSQRIYIKKGIQTKTSAFSKSISIVPFF